MTTGLYTWRATDARDRNLIEHWLDQDPHHAGSVDADFFMVQRKGTAECFAVEDELGLIVFYVRMSTPDGLRLLWLNMQFGPDGGRAERVRVSRALVAGFDWMKTAALGAGIEEIGFTTSSPALRTFAVDRLGFRSDGERFAYMVVAPSRNRVARKRVATVA